MLKKVIFFVVATIVAFGAAAASGGAIAGIGYLTGMTSAAVITAASTIAIAAFSVTIGIFALAAFLFLGPPPATANREGADQHQGGDS